MHKDEQNCLTPPKVFPRALGGISPGICLPVYPEVVYTRYMPPCVPGVVYTRYMPPYVPERRCIYPGICLPMYPRGGVPRVHASLCTEECIPGYMPPLPTRFTVGLGIMPPYHPVHCWVCRRVPQRGPSRDGPLFPFHCWPALQSPRICTFINF